jgi:hypothetical protein
VMDHVRRYGRLGYDVSQQSQLGPDSRDSPRHILARRLSNQPTDLRLDPWVTRLFPRLPSPTESESPPVPADDRLGLDDHEVGLPVGPKSREPDPQDPVRLSKSRAFHRALEDAELVAQCQDSAASTARGRRTARSRIMITRTMPMVTPRLGFCEAAS